MSEILTITQVEKWIYEKLNNNKQPPKGWEEQINLVIGMKEALLKKETNFDKTEIELQIGRLKELQYFLNKEEYSIPFEVPLAGIVQDGVIIIPIGTWKYLYNVYGLRGIVQIQMIPESKRWYMEIEGNQIYLKGEPLKEYSYELPDEELLKKWVNNKIRCPTTKEVWADLDNYYRTFLDIPELNYNALILFTFQTWLQDLTEAAFYISILGSWGAGKSAILKALCYVSYRGMYGDCSTAVIAWSIDEERVTIFIDYIDS